jgi:hypothetical protein
MTLHISLLLLLSVQHAYFLLIIIYIIVVVIVYIHSVLCDLYCVCSFMCCVSFARGVILCDVCYLFVVLLYYHCHWVKTHLQLK